MTDIVSRRLRFGNAPSGGSKLDRLDISTRSALQQSKSQRVLRPLMISLPKLKCLGDWQPSMRRVECEDE